MVLAPAPKFLQLQLWVLLAVRTKLVFLDKCQTDGHSSAKLCQLVWDRDVEVAQETMRFLGDLVVCDES